MSEWNRGDREAEQRRYGQDNRVDRRDERRFGQGEPWRGGRQEGRSFDGRDQERFGAGYGADYGRSHDRGRVEEAMYRPSSPRQPYDERQRQAQSYGRGQEDMRRGQGGIVGNNEPVRRVTDGETDHAMWSNMQGGQHRGRGPKNYTRSDQRISEDINDRLTDDDWLDASEIDVQVSSCEVTLTGSVNSRDERRRAEDIAESVSGVKHVQNNLRVQQPQAGARSGRTGEGGDESLAPNLI